MHIAYISYEYPPDTAFGGIATYMYQVSRAMQQRGHLVEVFCASGNNVSYTITDETGIVIHRIATSGRRYFKEDLLPVFKERQTILGFDLIESPEYNADGTAVKAAFPDIPMVVKFHTPSFFVKELNQAQRSNQFKERLKRFLDIKQYGKKNDGEYHISLAADTLCAPSQAMKEVVCEGWDIAPEKITIIPNLFIPGPALLQIPAETQHHRISFIGRLEVRKGAHLLAEAIPAVLEQFPNLQFRFIGKSDPAPDGSGLMSDYIKKRLRAYLSNLEFIDAVAPTAIPDLLAATDICVFPSTWEAAGYVCLEAMSAARGIIAGCNGGMYDMIAPTQCGLLINPNDTASISHAIITLLKDEQGRIAMGIRARQRIVDYYAGEVVSMNEQFYEQMIAEHRYKNNK
jgi:glycogen synthase